MTTKSIGTTMMDEKTRESILSRLSGYRYTHTLGCERAARQLAFRFGYDPERAGFAALLHDITKRLSKEEQLQLCEKYDIIPCDIEMREWKMLHGRTAAAIAAAEYGADSEICEAIAFHTTGRPSSPPSHIDSTTGICPRSFTPSCRASFTPPSRPNI